MEEAFSAVHSIGYHFYMDWEVVAGGIIAFLLGCVFCALDIYQTISLSDFQSENLFRSTYVNAFIVINGAISTGVFVATCIYQGQWIGKVIGQDIDNPLLRAAVVGVTITVIIRSRLLNLQGNSGASGGFGVDAGYSLLRTLVLKKLNIMTTLKIRLLASQVSESVKDSFQYDRDTFLRYLRSVAEDIIDSTYAYDVPRRDRIKEQFNKSTASPELMSEGMVIKWAMTFCGMPQIKPLIDNWVLTQNQKRSHLISQPVTTERTRL